MTTTRGSTGAGLTELLVSAALVGVIAAISAPTFHSYVNGGALKAGAEELAALMNLARSVAIKENTRVCVKRDPGGSNRVRLLVGSANPCAAASFYGAQGRGFDARIDAEGWIALQNQVAVDATTADVIFTALGLAVPGGAYTVRKGDQTLNVVVAPTGRVTITP
jgi:Tfp pilus assembly protein FimT